MQGVHGGGKNMTMGPMQGYMGGGKNTIMAINKQLCNLRKQ